MPLDLHTVELIAPAQSARQDRLLMGMQLAVASAAGAGAGDSVTVAVAFEETLPADYAVVVNPDQDATWYVPQSSKTATGFNVVLNPRLASATLAAGAIDVLVFG